MYIQQFFTQKLANMSYLLGGTNNCAIIDPNRDVEMYLEAAKKMGMKITHILETHPHADFNSGHLELADTTGAKIYGGEKSNYQFDHSSLKEGDTFEIDDLLIKVIDTPGHTPDHISYIVVDKARGDDPVCIFSGDLLFVGDVGRPDLFTGKEGDLSPEQLAPQLFDTLHDKILTLPDYCEVYPAHGAGSLCGREMGAKRSSTIGYEKKYNAALQIKDKVEFVRKVTAPMQVPDYFLRSREANIKGPELTKNLPELLSLSPVEFKKNLDQADVIVVDIRKYETFCGQHILGSYNIDFEGNFPTFAGWVLPFDKDILIVSDQPTQAQEAVMWLRRVGLDRVVGYLEGGTFAWAKEGYPLGHVKLLSSEELYQRMNKGSDMVLIDVRSAQEYEKHHIEGAINIPVANLREQYKELDKEKPIAVICGSGQRSSLGVSLLRQRGIEEIYNVSGGMVGYSSSGYAPECPLCMAPHLPRFLGTKMEEEQEEQTFAK